MAYYKIRFEVWCDWDPAESSLREIGQQVICGDRAVCTLLKVLTVVARPQDIEDKDAMIFFGGEGRDADETQG